MINGQKMFTTYAHRADYCFLLTRSVPGSTGPKGLTMLLVPLDTPGIEIQPVHTMGYERTNIVFYNEVRVSNDLVVGEPDHGLSVIRAALEAEQSVAPSSRTRQLYESARAWAASATDPAGRPVAADPTVRARLARLSIDAEVADLLGIRVAFLEQLGGQAGASRGAVRARDLRRLVQGGARHGRPSRNSRLVRPRVCGGGRVRVPLSELPWRARSTAAPVRCCVASSPSSHSACLAAGPRRERGQTRVRRKEGQSWPAQQTLVTGLRTRFVASSTPSTPRSAVAGASASTRGRCGA